MSASPFTRPYCSSKTVKARASESQQGDRRIIGIIAVKDIAAL